MLRKDKQKTKGMGSGTESGKHDISVLHRGKMRSGEIVRELEQKLIQPFFFLLRSKNTETIKFPFLVSYPWPCVVFQHFLSGAVMNAAAARQYMSCSLAVSISFLLCFSSSSFFPPLPLSLRSTALSWFGVESEWPVVFPHWELPCLQTLSTSTNPCRAKPLCSRTPHSLPAHWVCSKGKSGNSTASVKNAVWNLLWLQRDLIFERSELSGPL